MTGAQAPMSKPLRVFLTRRWPKPVEDAFQALFHTDLNMTDRPLDSAGLADVLARYDVVCPTITDRLDNALLARPPRARLLANYGAGYNHIDLSACREAGILVSNTPDVLSAATAELTVLLMLMASRRASEGERLVRDRAWTGWAPTQLLGEGLAGKTLGLVGFGRIAQRVGQMARAAFDMPVSYYARRRASLDAEAMCQATFIDDLDQLLVRSDVVSIHVPGGEATRRLIDADRLARLPANAILINTARGDVVDEAALAQALIDRRIAGAGLDVYESEPQVHPLLASAPNVSLLPHLGSATRETRIAMGLRVLENVQAFAQGSEIPDRVA